MATSTVNKFDTNAFRKLLVEIKDLVRNTASLNQTDKDLLNDLLNILRYVVEFEVINLALSSDEVISVLPNINNRLTNIQNQMMSILKSAKDTQSMSKLEKMKIKSLSLSRSRLIDLKKSLETKDFKPYIDAMNRKLDSRRQIMAICEEVLHTDNEDFNSFFSSKLVNDDDIKDNLIELIYGVIHNNDLCREIRAYLLRENNYLTLKQEYDFNNQHLAYARLAHDNQDLIRSYIAKRTFGGKNIKERRILLQNRISKNTLRLEEIELSKFGGVRFIKEKAIIQESLNKDTQELLKIERSYPEYLEVEKKMREANLGFFVDNYTYELDPKNVTVEQKSTDYIKTTLNRTFMNIEPLQVAITKRNHEISETMEKAKLVLNKQKESLSTSAKTLIDKYHDDVVKMISLVDTQYVNSATPLLALYVLKALSDIKKIDYTDLKNASILTGDMDKIMNDYENLKQRIYQNLSIELTNIDSRSEYDITPFDEIKIL